MAEKACLKRLQKEYRALCKVCPSLIAFCVEERLTISVKMMSNILATFLLLYCGIYFDLHYFSRIPLGCKVFFILLCHSHCDFHC